MTNQITIAVGIPVYKAHNTLRKCLASVLAQTRCPDKVYISNDNPGDLYDDITSDFPMLNIEFIDCDFNLGPGVARNRILEKCTEDYITFIDADDTVTPYMIELLLSNINNPTIVVSQAAFLQPMRNQPRMTPQGPNMRDIAPLQFMPRNDIQHPWVFGRLYSVKYLKDNGFDFSSLRQMEDGYLNACIRLSIEGTQFQWAITDMPVYLWNEGSEHSITRIHTKSNEIPVYNYGSCAIGADLAHSMAIAKVGKKNPFTPAIPRMAAEIMVNKYFQLFEVKDNYSEFYDINYFLAVYWYHNIFSKWAATVERDVLEQIYLQHPNTFKHIPDMTFTQFMDNIAAQQFSKEAILTACKNLPDDIIKCQQESGCTSYDIVEKYM